LSGLARERRPPQSGAILLELSCAECGTVVGPSSAGCEVLQGELCEVRALPWVNDASIKRSTKIDV